MPLTDTELADLLCLSALTYRGYTRGLFAADAVRGAIESGLGIYPDRRFELVWGPDRYRSPVSLVDDSMMFVARRSDAPRYVVAIRGTNPISAFDWVLGDLWVSRPVPWPYGAPDGSTVSMSTALGLIMLQHMRSGAVGLVGELAERAAALGTALAQRARRTVETIRALALPERNRAATDDNLECWIRDVFDAAPRLDRAAGDAAHRELFEDLETHVRLESLGRSGLDLASFLKGEVAREGEVDVVVTGHSKGGALAPALALWLHEVRDWDPDRRATLHCAAFAGPSPGNRAFAQRFERAFGDRFDRVVNELDIVPRAWEPATLSQIAELYDDPGPRCPSGLAGIVRSISQRVGGLGYAHLGGRTTTLRPDLDKRADSFIAQLIHQHLDGYFRAYGLPWKARDFFDPTP